MCRHTTRCVLGPSLFSLIYYLDEYIDTQIACVHQAGLEGLRLLVREQAATIEALRAEQVRAQYLVNVPPP